MRHAFTVEQFQKFWRGIGFNGVKRPAGKLFDKIACRTPCGVWTIQQNWDVRTKSLRQLLCIMEIVQLKGTPTFLLSIELPCGFAMKIRGRPWGSAGGYMFAFTVCKVSLVDKL